MSFQKQSTEEKNVKLRLIVRPEKITYKQYFQYIFF